MCDESTGSSAVPYPKGDRGVKVRQKMSRDM
jgi:hypothetical protein